MSRRARNDSGVSGGLVVDKPAGMTSHDVVARVRKALGTRKVGHAGTLDPDATGVLVIGVGKATRLLTFVTGSAKSYLGEVRFGAETDTLDSSGQITGRYEMVLRPESVRRAAAELTGELEQIPPMVSAVRVDGKRLHQLAREGKEVERPPRPVTVTRFDVEPTDDPLVYRIEVDCSSGTYIRVLAADLGAALGGGAHLHGLRRTAVGPFTLDEACELDALELRPVIDLAEGMARRVLDDGEARSVSHGRRVSAHQDDPADEPLALVGPDGDLWAVAERRGPQLVPSVLLRPAGDG